MNRLIKKFGIAAMAAALPLSAVAEVSISGWINQEVTYADDGIGSDITTVSGGNGTTLGSRLTFAASSEVLSNMTAGIEVILEPGGDDNNVLGFGAGGQGDIDSFNNSWAETLGVLGHSAYLSGSFGKLTVGTQSMPTDNIAVLEDPSVTLWPSISAIFHGTGVRMKNNGAAIGNASFGSFASCYTQPVLRDGLGIGIDCNGTYRTGIRYDLPALGPISIAVGYANDDIYDFNVKYKGDIANLKTSIAVGYAQNNQGSPGLHDRAEMFAMQAGVMDPGTGLFGSIAYQNEDADLVPDMVTAGLQDSTYSWWFKGGIKKSFNSLGDTAIAFQYGQYNDQYSLAALDAAGGVGQITGSELERMGVEVTQYVGSSLILYAVWENLDVGVEGPGAAIINGADELDMFTAGLTFFF